MGRNSPDTFNDKLHLHSAPWTPRCLWVCFPNLLPASRVEICGCCFNEEFPEAMSVAVSTHKGHWIKFSHRIASISVTVVWTTRYQSVRNLCCFLTCSISWSHSSSKLAGWKNVLGEHYCRLVSLPPLPTPVLFYTALCRSLQPLGTLTGDTFWRGDSPPLSSLWRGRWDGALSLGCNSGVPGTGCGC